MKKMAIMVISGHNSRAIVAFCRWASTNNISYHIIAAGEDDPIFLTEYRIHVAFVRSSNSLVVEHFQSWAKELCRVHGYDQLLILPSTEYLNRFLLANRKEIEANHCIVPLCSEDLYKKISDKHSFSSLCRSYQLDVPEEFYEIPSSFPFVAKPRSYDSEGGKQLVPHLIMNQMDKDVFMVENPDDYFFQQYVHGRSLYLLAYIGHREIVAFSQENLMQQARGGSIILAKNTHYHSTLSGEKYLQMLQDQDFHGLIMVEVRQDKGDGKYYMIEANPRLWGPLQFVVDNNVDILGAFLRDFGFDVAKPEQESCPDAEYFWSGGITSKSQPVAYHSYSGEEFVRDIPMLRTKDIFFRKDTLDLFFKESKLGMK